MRGSEALLFSAVIIAVALFHLIYGYRTGKVIMGASWRIARADSPVAYWLVMMVSALCLAAGLYLGIVGFPDRAGS